MTRNDINKINELVKQLDFNEEEYLRFASISSFYLYFNEHSARTLNEEYTEALKDVLKSKLRSKIETLKFQLRDLGVEI